MCFCFCLQEKNPFFWKPGKKNLKRTKFLHEDANMVSVKQLLRSDAVNTVGLFFPCTKYIQKSRISTIFVASPPGHPSVERPTLLSTSTRQKDPAHLRSLLCSARVPSIISVSSSLIPRIRLGCLPTFSCCYRLWGKKQRLMLMLL